MVKVLVELLPCTDSGTRQLQAHKVTEAAMHACIVETHLKDSVERRVVAGFVCHTSHSLY